MLIKSNNYQFIILFTIIIISNIIRFHLLFIIIITIHIIIIINNYNLLIK
jgi:hypothetical protein